MESQAQALKDRTKRFAIRVITLFRLLPRTDEARIIGKQLLRSATPVAANYRSVCRARSRADFVAKLSLVVEETDETVFWLELLSDSGTLQKDRVDNLTHEASELLAIFAASQRTVRSPDRAMNK